MARWALALVVAALVVLALERWVATPYRLSSASMEPTLHCAHGTANCLGGRADVVLADRLEYHFRAPRRGDVVVLRLAAAAARRCGGERTLVKRVIGLPGERVGERDGTVSIDGRALREPYVDLFHRDHGPARGWTVPRGAYFVLGDNRADSCDSRAFGALPRRDIVGEAVAIVWPLGRIRTGL